MMFLLKNLKTVVSVFLITFVLNNQVFAQVKTGMLKCNDLDEKYKFSVHFKGREVLLLLKGYTYRVPYTRSFVARTGDRVSVYENREIKLTTMSPYSFAVVDITTMPSDDHIATAICK
jgi:hypothetical protein